MDAYRLSFRKLGVFLEQLADRGADEVSVYCLSKANLQRSVPELDAVIEAFDELSMTIRSLQQAGHCRSVAIVGRLDLLPAGATGRLLIPARIDGEGLDLNLLVCYDAWDEMREAVKRTGSDVSLRDLSVSTLVDAIVRTGGGILMSGLLPMQSQYAHLVVTDTLFNDLSDEAISELIGRAASVEHRFGA